MANGVTRATVPEGCGIHSFLERASFFDAWQVAMPPGISAMAFYLRVVSGSPAWVNLLMGARNQAVRLVGLKDLGALGDFDRKRAPESYRVGDRVGIFRVLALSDDEVILGESDRHLDVKVSLCRRGAQAVVTTVVHEHNALGRCYMLLVRPFHRRIVPALLARAEVAA